VSHRLNTALSRLLAFLSDFRPWAIPLNSRTGELTFAETLMLVPLRVSEFRIDHAHKDCPIGHRLVVESESYTSVKLAVDRVTYCTEPGNQAWGLAIAFIKRTNVPQ